MTQPAPALPYADPTAADPLAERRAVAKVLARVIPLMILLYLFNYLDRQNLMFAKKAMQADLGWFDEAAYGLGAGLFFVGYFVFEVPSNLIMERVGARLWMARIMVTWGLISTCMMFVREPWHLYALRLLLGIAEAGFFPGMILYLTYWVPTEHRSRAAAWFLTSTALSGAVGGPVSDLLLNLSGFGMHGWQWLFVIEGVPSVLLGLLILVVLCDRPAQARWLTDAEKAALEARLSAERASMPASHHGLRAGLADPRVLVLCLLYGALIFGFYVVNYWTADLVRHVLPADTRLPIGTLSAIPFAAAIVTMSAVGPWADRTGRLRGTIVVMALVAAGGYVLAANARGPYLMIAALAVAAAANWSTLGPFWALPSRFLTGTAAAAGIGVINAVGNLLGGFLGPNMMGQLKKGRPADGLEIGLWATAGVLVAAAGIAGAMGRLMRKQTPTDGRSVTTLPVVPAVPVASPVATRQ
ncbi:MAG TPA: MFS transporter [Humisphaera sp.]